MDKFVIIVAGGSGTRMQSNIPKQFLPLGSSVVLMQTINAFFEAIENINIIIVLPENQFDIWTDLCHQFRFSIKHSIIKGGSSRFQSVKNGLFSIETVKGIVAIHDGVRPLVHKKTIVESFEYAVKYGSAIATLKLKDSIREIKSNMQSIATDRNNFLSVQTPQTFDLLKLKIAYDTPELSHFTDDASVFEHASNQVFTFEGTYDNIKITTPEDLLIAQCIKIQKS